MPEVGTPRLRAIAGRALDGVPASFLGNAFWQYVSATAAMGFGFVYSIVVARALGVASYGLLAAVTAFAMIVFQALELRLHEVVVRYLVKFEAEGDTARMVALAKLSLAVDLATCTLAGSAAVVLGRLAAPAAVRGAPFGILIFGVASIFTANAGIATATGLLRVLDGFRAQAIITAVAAFAKLSLTWAALHFLGAGLLEVLAIAAAVTALSNSVQVTLALIMLRRRAHLGSLHAPIHLLKPQIGEIVRFVRSTYLLSLAQIPTKDLDVNVLAIVAPLAEVGAYRMAKNFYTAAAATTDPLFFAVYPEIARLWANRKGREIARFARRLTLLLGTAAAAFLPALYFGVPWVIGRFMGSSFDPSTVMFRWMLLGLAGWMPFLWVSPLMMAAGRPEVTLKGAVIGSLFALVLYVVTAEAWGGPGVAATTGLSSALVIGAIVLLGLRSGVFAEVARMRDEC